MTAGKLKRAAASPKTLGRSLILSAIGSGVAAVAMIWPTLRGDIPLAWWIAGLFLVNVASYVFHRSRERAA